jgi:hypothetical protein
MLIRMYARHSSTDFHLSINALAADCLAKRIAIA